MFLPLMTVKMFVQKGYFCIKINVFQLVQLVIPKVMREDAFLLEILLFALMMNISKEQNVCKLAQLGTISTKEPKFAKNVYKIVLFVLVKKHA